MGDKATVIGWATQTTILSHSSVSLFICHMGWNSFCEAMGLGGIPNVRLPLLPDQLENADMMENKLNIGKSLWKNAAESVLDRHIVKKTIQEIMNNPTFIGNAAKLKQLNEDKWDTNLGSSMKKLKEFCDEVDK
ncbi:unnamed protein product [Cunninghamella echinulata]